MARAEAVPRPGVDLRGGLSSASGFVVAWLLTTAVVRAWELAGGAGGSSVVPDLLWGQYLSAVVSALVAAAVLGSVGRPRLSTPLRGLVVMGGASVALVLTTVVVSAAATPLLVGVLVFSGAPLWIFLACLLCLAAGTSRVPEPGPRS